VSLQSSREISPSAPRFLLILSIAALLCHTPFRYTPTSGISSLLDQKQRMQCEAKRIHFCLLRDGADRMNEHEGAVSPVFVGIELGGLAVGAGRRKCCSLAPSLITTTI
jgi:hypothetical protein